MIKLKKAAALALCLCLITGTAVQAKAVSAGETDYSAVFDAPHNSLNKKEQYQQGQHILQIPFQHAGQTHPPARIGFFRIKLKTPPK